VADNAPLFVEAVATAGGRRDLLILTTRDRRVLARDARSGDPIWSRRNPPGDWRINNGRLSCYTTASAADGHTYLYVASGGHPGDRGDYQGHTTVIGLAHGRQRAFNCNCSARDVHFEEQPGRPDCPARRSAVWARAGVVYYSPLNRIYLATGNGPFNPSSGNWGDSVLALHPDGSGSGGGPLDSYTPADFQYLAQADQDLGSTAPAILPVPASSAVRHLALQGGKDGKLRLLDLASLNAAGVVGRGGGEVGQAIPVPQGGEVLTAPAVWTDPADGSTWVFVANAGGTAGLQVGLDG